MSKLILTLMMDCNYCILHCSSIQQAGVNRRFSFTVTDWAGCFVRIAERVSRPLLPAHSVSVQEKVAECSGHGKATCGVRELDELFREKTSVRIVIKVRSVHELLCLRTISNLTYDYLQYSYLLSDNLCNTSIAVTQSVDCDSGCEV